MKHSRIIDGKKTCTKCEELKSFDDFLPKKDGVKGLSPGCKRCMLIYYEKRRRAAGIIEFRVYLANKEKKPPQKDYRSNYRRKNKERDKIKRLLNNLKRRALKKSVSDGTITVSTLREVLSTDRCFYCNKPTESSKKSIDHKIPLVRNGIHGVSNIVMACISCNSRKRTMTDEEFFAKQSIQQCVTRIQSINTDGFMENERIQIQTGNRYLDTSESQAE